MSLIEKYRPKTPAIPAIRTTTLGNTDFHPAIPVLFPAIRTDDNSGIATNSKRVAPRKPFKHKESSRNSTNSSPTESENVNLHGQNYFALKKLAGDDWLECENDPRSLEAFAKSVATRKLREEGIKPDSYTQASQCRQCGPIYLWKGAPTEVEACVWCFNRVTGVDIPRPELISCSQCDHFVPNDYTPNAGMGGCHKGLRGKFANQQHSCNYFSVMKYG